MPDWRRAPGTGRYARPEVERRFLVVGDPGPGPSREIEDRYLDGTSLRLRHVRGDGVDVWKLTQKVRPDPGDPAVVAITNTYLTADEHARLSVLPGAVLRKTRSVHGPFVVDVFHGALAGLVLAEAELADLAAPLELPSWLGREVTHDDQYSGGRLARVGSPPA